MTLLTGDIYTEKELLKLSKDEDQQNLNLQMASLKADIFSLNLY